MSDAVLARDTRSHSTSSRFSLRRLAIAGTAIAIAAGAAGYGYDWWTNGRFIQTTDDAYVGGNVTIDRAACCRLHPAGSDRRQPAASEAGQTPRSGSTRASSRRR